jgi:aminobenzoyl-glutamate transport protein
MKNKLVTTVALLLMLAEIVLIVVSWFLSAMMTEGVASLLSSEGVRWFFSQFVTMVQTPLLVWILLLAMAYGCLRAGVFAPMEEHRRSKKGWKAALIVSVLYVCLLLLLTVVPHAVLLSATGNLFPSPFSRALIPLIALGIILYAVTYGLAAHTFRSLSEVMQSFTDGLAGAAPIVLVYILFIQFYESLRYVFF